MVPGAEQRRWWLSLILVGLLVVDSLSALEPSKDPDEIALQQENVGTDTASLVAYLNSRANNDELLLKLEKHTQELGSANFKQRELATNALIRLGCVAVPQLQRALESRDQEVQKRAEHCLEAIQKQPYARSPSIAVRLLRWRQAPELVETYLGFLPYAGDAKIEEAICFGLDAHCARQKECNPHLLAALKDAVALRRAIAGCLVARYGSDLHRERARVLLRDPDSKVRLRTAQGFLASGNPIGMPVLVELLTDPSWEVRIQAEELLAWGAGKDRPTSRTSITSLPDANQALQVWRDWWNKNHRHVDLKARLSEPRRPRLIFFIEEGESSVATGRVWLAGSDGSQRWGLTGLARPVMVHCEPEGWILLTEQGIKSSPGRVRSLNVRNFTRWTFQDIEDPVSAFPFASGAINVVSAKSELLRLNSRGRCTHRSPIKFESDSDKPSRLTFGESPHHVTGFDNTYTGGNLCSVDLRTPQETRYLGLLNVSNKELHLEVLSSSYLVVSDNGCVALYDAIDGFRWRTLMPGAVQASRLASGNFLICGQGRVTEVSKEGFVVWERFLATQPERFQLCSPLLGLAFSLPSEEQRTRAPSIRLESYQNEDARLPIAKYLAKYAVSLPEGVERLRGLLKDQRQEVQDVARAGLVAYDANPLIQTIKRIRTDRDVSKRCDLIMEGFRGASNDRLWAPVFLEALKDPHEEVRWYGANGAGCCDLEADILVPVLIKSVQKEGAKIRNMAIMSLGRMGRKGQQAIPLLIEVAQGNDEDSSYFAAFSLGRIGDDPRILPVLVELLRSKDSRRRRGALEGIWSLKPNSQEVYARLKDALKACRKQPASKSTNDEQKQIESVIQRLAMPDRGD